MNITITFFIGLIVALIGVIPPGLLNMTAAKISLKEGYGRGIIFSIGVCVTVIIQIYVAVIFASYLSNHPDIVDVLQRVAMIIFILISIYFLFIAKSKPKLESTVDSKSKRSRFFYGMVLSALNVFPIPYQAYMSITIVSFGWMTFDKIDIISYVAGAAMGTFITLYVYIFFFDKIKGLRLTTQKTMNRIIGVITAIIALITLINVIKEM